MATGLFGAPNGFIAAEDQANKTALTQVNAQKTLADIEQMPVQTDLMRAQAEHARALAGTAGAKTADLAAMAQWEAAAAKAGAVIPATQGREANVDDVQQFKPGSVADPLRKLYDFMVQGGAPSRLTLPLAKEIASITEKEAVSGYRGAQQSQIEQKMANANLEDIGMMVGMAMQSPEAYNQMRLLATQAGKKLPPDVKNFIDGLPQGFEEGKAALKQLQIRALSMKDQLALEQKERELEAKKKLDASTIARNAATASAATARSGLVKEQTTWLKKLGGDKTAEALSGSETLNAVRYQQLEAQRIKLHPLLPVDRSSIRAGRTYTMADRSVARPLFDASGKLTGFEEVEPPLPTRPAPRSADAIRKALRATNVAVPGDEED